MKTYPAEPLDLMQYINTKFHEPFIHERIEYSAAPDMEKLIQAAEKLAEVFPLIKCRYDFATNTFIEIENFKAVNLFDCADRESDSLLTWSLDTSEKLIEFILCGKVLYITASHLICDGNGFKMLLYAFCGYYGGREVNGSCFMNRAFSALFGGVKTSMFKMLASMLGGYKNRQIYEKTGNEQVYVIERTIDKEVMSAAHTRAKRHAATMNDVLMTAYARAQGKLSGENKINVPCTSDLRKYAKENAGIGNLTGTLNLNVKIKDGESFADTLIKVSRIMRGQKQSGNDIAGPALLVKKYQSSTLEKFLKVYGNINTSPYCDYTNLGVLDEGKLSLGDIRAVNAVGYGGLQKAPYFMLAASTFRGKLTLSSIVMCGESQKTKVERLIDEVVNEICAFAA